MHDIYDTRKDPNSTKAALLGALYVFVTLALVAGSLIVLGFGWPKALLATVLIATAFAVAYALLGGWSK
jgi:hypothetical protein